MINVSTMLTNIKDKVGSLCLTLDGTHNGDRYRKYVPLKIKIPTSQFRNGRVKIDYDNAKAINKKIEEETKRYESIIEDSFDKTFPELASMLDAAITGKRAVTGN